MYMYTQISRIVRNYVQLIQIKNVVMNKRLVYFCFQVKYMYNDGGTAEYAWC